MEMGINTKEKLKEEIENLYQKTDKDILSDYLKNESLTHTINGCMDCPFSRKREIMDKSQEKIIEHSYCLWDKNKSSIVSFMSQPNLSPIDCPLNKKNIEIKKK